MDQPTRQRVRATIVGSLPKPGWLAEPGELFPPWHLEGPNLAEGQEDAVRLWVTAQERAGLDVVTDGEQRRRHYIWGFFAGLDGIDTVNLAMRAQRAQRYHKEIAAARLIGEPVYRGPIFVDALRATQAMTSHPIKVTLPGPMTIVDSIVDTVGGRTEAELAMRFAELLNLEARALAVGGRRRHPVRRTLFQRLRGQGEGLGMAALERAAEGVAATKAVHICYGYGTEDVKRWKSANRDWSHYETTLPLLAKSTIDQVSLETAASGVDSAVIESLRGKDVLLGVIDVGNETVETPETVARRLHAALRYIDPEHLYACTDCGMLPLSRTAAEGKLRALADGVAMVNAM